MVTEFPNAFATAFAAGVGLGFLCAFWGVIVQRVVWMVRLVTRLGEDV